MGSNPSLTSMCRSGHRDMTSQLCLFEQKTVDIDMLTSIGKAIYAAKCLFLLWTLSSARFISARNQSEIESQPDYVI
jgi:hypothetical protein